MLQPFDAVILIAFGGPLGPADVRPFLANVLRGRNVPPHRVDAVARHYEPFDGVSPLSSLTRRQAAGLRIGLQDAGLPLPVYVGMRNWHPYLADTLAEMSRAGVRRAIAFIAAAHRSYSSCTQYRENVALARAALAADGLPDVEVTYVSDWHLHPDFIAANAENATLALERLPAALRGRARLVFTAHSIPLAMAGQYPYRQQFEATAERVAQDVRGRWPSVDYATVYQSRSGRPEDPWLGPDISEYLREQGARGLAAAVICPIGFLCDHIEILYDLDIEAAGACREVGLRMERAHAVNDHPRFLAMMVDVVAKTYQRYGDARPLEVVGVSSG